MLEFSKYQGAGNDFILIDNRQSAFNKDKMDIAQLCHRRFGIGADGLILLEAPTLPQEDFSMVYYNADGRQSTMCGNGGRCITKFAQDLGLIKQLAHFSAIDGQHEAEIKKGQVALKMTAVSSIEEKDGDYCIDTGSPHYIKFVDNVAHIAVEEEGRRIRNSAPFKKDGINVNFVEQKGTPHKIRTYERGVEAETYACGTGATAAAIALFLSGNADNKVQLQTLGGHLQVHFTPQKTGFSDVWLTGPAERTFTGIIKP